MQLAHLALAGGVVLVAGVWVLHRWLRGAVRPAASPPPCDAYPPLTVIRPIRGLDVGAAENIAAALDHGYPGSVRTIFVFDDDDEPALPLVREAIRVRRAAGHADAEILFCGHPPPGRTGKLNAMGAALAQTHTELVVVADSDIRPDRGTLTALVDTISTARDAGAAFAPVVSSEPPLTVGDAAYALLLNGLYGPAAAVATRQRHGELPFIMGQMMVLRRSALEAIGGVASADGQLVDDMYLGARLNDAGYRNLVAPHPISVIQQGLGLREFLQVFVRWITFSRTGLPLLSFRAIPFLHGVAFFLGVFLSLVGLARGDLLAAALAALAPVGVALSINRLHVAVGGAPLRRRHGWVAAALVLLSPLVLLRTLLARQVTWRGRSYALDAGARLDATAGPRSGDHPRPLAH